MSSDSENRKYLSNAAGYDRWASSYDRYPNPTVAMDELAFPGMWRHLRGKRVLEIGCGTGRHTAKLVSAGNSVVGIDLSTEMLAVARAKVPSAEAAFIEADFMAYGGFAPATFDAALASLVVEHIRDLDELFRRVARVLKPGGELYSSDIHPARTSQGTFAHFKDPVAGEEIHLESHAHTAERIRAAALRAGFEVVREEEALSSRNPRWAKYLGQPMIQMWKLRRRR